jgi:hypothetical protein
MVRPKGKKAGQAPEYKAWTVGKLRVALKEVGKNLHGGEKKAKLVQLWEEYLIAGRTQAVTRSKTPGRGRVSNTARSARGDPPGNSHELEDVHMSEDEDEEASGRESGHVQMEETGNSAFLDQNQSPARKSLPVAPAAPAESPVGAGAGLSADALAIIAQAVATATAQVLRPFLGNPGGTGVTTHPMRQILTDSPQTSPENHQMNFDKEAGAQGNPVARDVIGDSRDTCVQGAGAESAGSRPGIPPKSNSAMLGQDLGKSDVHEPTILLEQAGVSINSLPDFFCAFMQS